MKVNVIKTKVMAFARGRARRKPTFMYDGERVEVVKQYKYLGLTMAENGKWDAHIQVVCNQAHRLLPALYKFLFLHPNIPISLALHLFDALIVPVLLYGCEIWAWSTKVDKLGKVARQFYKRILRLPTSASGVGVELLLGRVSLGVIAKIRAMKYFARILRLPEDRLVRKALVHQANKFVSGIDCWMTPVKQELDRHGFGYVWLEGHNNTNKFLAEYKERTLRAAFQDQQYKAGAKPSTTSYMRTKISRGIDGFLKRSDDVQARRVYSLIMLNNPGSYVHWSGRDKMCTQCGARVDNIFLHRILSCPHTARSREASQRHKWYVGLHRAAEADRFLYLQRRIISPEIMKEITPFF
jgi:hypothetical protein